MAEEKPILPPPSVPVRGFTTPVNQEGFFSERVDYTTPEYREIQRGTKYSTIVGADPNVVDQFAELYFLREVREIGAYPWATRFWATDTLAEDSYNSAVEYVSEAVTYPAYTRSYTIRRDSYEASTTLAIGSPLTSVIGIKVTDGGQDYTEATISITGTGSDATAEAVIDTDGTIASIIVTNCGTDYTETPTIEIIGDGGGALAIGIIQPQSAVLVSQKKTEFPEEKLNTGGQAYAHPLKNEYVIVTRVYETLPGPWVYSQKEDTDGGLVTVKTRRNISADITVEETLVSALWSDTTKKGVDDFVAEETVESRDIVIDDTSAGTATKMTTSRVDEDGKTVTVTRTQASAAYLASITPRETVSGGIWTRITSEPISHLKVWLITETRPLPGNAMVSTKIDEDGATISFTKTLKDTSTITSSETANTGFWIRTHKEEVSDLVAHEVIESRVLPGNAIPYTRIDDDGKVVSGSRTLKRSSLITSTETLIANVWTHTFKKDVSDLVSWEITETRAIPGNQVESTKVDEDGVEIQIFTTLKDTTLITTEETVAGGFWNRTHKEEVSDLVAKEVKERRAIPGNTLSTEKIDEDGLAIGVFKTMDTLAVFNAITPRETVSGGFWTRHTCESISDLVVWKVQESRAIPGNPIPETKFEEDGNEIDTVRTLKAASTITTQETLIAGVWHRTTKKAVTDLVAWEIVEARDIPGVAILSARVGEDGETELITSTVKDATVIVPGQTESAGTLTTIEQKRISELISEEERSVKDWLDTAQYSVSIPEGIIPLEFRAGITTTIESHIIAGVASMPTLAAGEFEHSQKQLTKRLYEERITQLGDVTFPINQTGTETSSQFGGAVLDVVRTLSDSLLAADEGEDIVASFVNPIGDSLMWFKETKKRPASDGSWPILASRLWDENMRLEYDETSQVLLAGTSEDPAPGGSVFAWVSEVKGVDKWRSKKINVSKLTPDYVDESSALITYDYRPFRFPGWLTLALAGYYVRAAHADLCQQTIRTWWVQSANPPAAPTVDEIIMDNPIISTLNSTSTLAYAGECLHDDLTTFITLFWPATTPSMTVYTGTWIGTERIIAATVTPEREKDIWKFQTRSVVMR